VDILFEVGIKARILKIDGCDKLGEVIFGNQFIYSV
jgi:hypothetical protein